MIQTFFIEPTGRAKIGLRRYRSTRNEDTKKCPLQYSYHNKIVWVGEATEKRTSDGYIESTPVDSYQDDPRWPAKCDCGYAFDPMDEADQVFTETIYRRTDTGEEMTQRDAPAGAIWNAWWMPSAKRPGGDGMYLCCRMPGNHDWAIDGRATNCDSPCKVCGVPYHAHENKGHNYEDARPHQCWIRHGPPSNLTVDKNGVTCGAGAGSIVVPGWHGFLTAGILKPC